MTPFFKLTLRTTDAEGARAFYASVLGARALHIVPLHEAALARDARPHWLGYLDVGDVDLAASSFTARGATALSPSLVNPEGLKMQVLRDPGGAIVALGRPPAPTPPPGDVGWYLLHTQDVERATANYGALCGWEFKPPVDAGPHGVLHPFSWEPGGPPVGSMADVAGRAGVHPHWLFHLRVPSLDAAVEAARAGGGTVLGPFTTPAGWRVAVCDDPQGAAFALREG